MASSAAAYGLRPVKLLGDRPFNGSNGQYKIASGYGTNIFYGDVVKLVTAGTVEKDTGTTTATPIGIFMGCEYTDPTLGYKLFSQYYPASTVASDIMAFVCDDPFVVMQAQADGSLAQTALGSNFALVQGSGSTTTGNSAVAIDQSSGTSTSTLPLRLIGFVEKEGISEVGDAYTDCLVMWNFGTHQLLGSTGFTVA
jgi:hypothetical protein